MRSPRRPPTAHVQPGDPDPCPRERGERAMCWAYLDNPGEWPWVCTRLDGHSGHHIAGTGFMVGAVWPENSARRRPSNRLVIMAITVWLGLFWALMFFGLWPWAISSLLAAVAAIALVALREGQS